jgi:hypothetical protein
LRGPSGFFWRAFAKTDPHTGCQLRVGSSIGAKTIEANARLRAEVLVLIFALGLLLWIDLQPVEDTIN